MNRPRDNGNAVNGLLPQAAYAAALGCLPAVGPAWLSRALRERRPQEVWHSVLAGDLNQAADTSRRFPGSAAKSPDWSVWAAQLDVAANWGRLVAKGIDVLWPGAQGYPPQFTEHVYQPPGVLFVAGDLATLSRQPSVAIIGSRQCTSDGAATAFEMGQDLAYAGVCVVSGLASGIDGAAHAGAVSAMLGVSGRTAARGMTVGVAASGVDVVYPAKHAQLWRQVTSLGAIVSETPPGSPAQSWRFPSRNRIIAGLVNMVVVIECHIKSGSWHTVDAALSGNIQVAAVPGPVRASTSRGNNEMLARGAALVRHAADVLEYLGTAVPPSGEGPERASSPVTDGIGPLESEVLSALNHRPLCVDDLVERSGLPVTAVVVALEHLAERGLAMDQQGWWSKARPPRS